VFKIFQSITSCLNKAYITMCDQESGSASAHATTHVAHCGAPRGGQPPSHGGDNNTCKNSVGNNQYQNQNKPTCGYCSIPGHRQEDCRKRIRENKPCIGLNGSTYWPKPKKAPTNEDTEEQESQGAIGEMYTGQLASIFSGFQ
jgi:hypothetical protein